MTVDRKHIRHHQNCSYVVISARPDKVLVHSTVVLSIMYNRCIETSWSVYFGKQQGNDWLPTGRCPKEAGSVQETV